jgi:hypothetical protein
MTCLRGIAHQLDPALWVHEILGITPYAWQESCAHREAHPF